VLKNKIEVSQGSFNPTARDLQYHQLQDGAVLYDTFQDKVYTLNLTAAYVWNFCDGTRSVDEIIGRIEENICGASESVSKDTRNIILQFRDKGLLESSL